MSAVIDSATGNASVDGCVEILNRSLFQPEAISHLLEILGAATFGCSGLALDCLNPLPRTAFFTTDDMSPEHHDVASNRVQFFAELLKLREEGDDDETWPGYFEAINRWHQDHGYKEPSDSAYGRARAFALRSEIEALIEAANEAIKRGLAGLVYLGPLRWIPPRFIPEGEQFDASWKAGGGDAWQRLRREPELLERVNRFLWDALKSNYQLKCEAFGPVRSNPTPADPSPSDPPSARVSSSAFPTLHAMWIPVCRCCRDSSTN